MSSGFNTDVKVGDRVLHVQTEDRGPAHPSIDTVVYQNGRIFHRKSSSYEHFAASSDFNPEDLHFRVSEQHRTVIEALRAGELDAELAAAEAAANANSAPAPSPRSGPIQVQLLNPDSWLSAGSVSLQLEVVRRADRAPIAGAQVEASIDGALSGSAQTGVCDAKGRVKIKFPMPQLGRNDLTLVIVAKSDAAKDEIRFAMRTRTRRRPVSTPQ
jgi:hypothetical protein